LRMVDEGGVTTTPVAVPAEMVRVAGETRAGLALTEMVAAVPGPVSVLHVIETGVVAVKAVVARMVPAQAVSTSTAGKIREMRVLNTDNLLNS